MILCFCWLLTRIHNLVCDSEKQKVQSYRQKISKWQGQVSERLQALSRRAGLHLFQQLSPF